MRNGSPQQVELIDMIGLFTRGERSSMRIYVEVVPLISVIAGVLVLLVPKFLRYVVGIYLIAIGVIGMLH